MLSPSGPSYHSGFGSWQALGHQDCWEQVWLEILSFSIDDKVDIDGCCDARSGVARVLRDESIKIPQVKGLRAVSMKRLSHS